MTQSTPAIRLDRATKIFPSTNGGSFTAMREVTLDVAPGEFVTVVGPTGCGKSTTLSLISGLEPASGGTVTVGGAPVTGIPRTVGYMFQQDATLPWRTVSDNIALGLRYRGVSKADARARAQRWIDTVGLTGFERYYPHQLSGGMRKRVAMAQTLITEPEIILMDEPFGALDVQTRELMQGELLRLWAGTGAAVVFVTHDLTEAIALADRVVVMTAAPATVKTVVTVDLPRPRNVDEIRLDPHFLDLYRKVWEPLRDEVEIARKKGASRG
ncbi:ABC transporter ATP-binding protein [Micromonospora narathiwatensis]|uniref:NitT/TauT family transport system ATP-binding protein n=1 Tax=Micromonospora narathiwatensis TaxID=299146 RepID=A0A1A8ZR58_9ACTN|nr:ABC transporter ATP-binding protein [Micromonospora narathiwatensis]SBT46313.1 NitT/TauT family transport system ATP-binding protein [Micromonospora narathiwatensis]